MSNILYLQTFHPWVTPQITQSVSVLNQAHEEMGHLSNMMNSSKLIEHSCLHYNGKPLSHDDLDRIMGLIAHIPALTDAIYQRGHEISGSPSYIALCRADALRQNINERKGGPL